MVMDTLKDECKTATEAEKKDYMAVAKKLFSLMEKFFPEIKGRYIYEQKIHYDYKGFILSMKFDLYDTEELCLYDYKMCSIYAWMYPESRESWTKQTNIYAFGLRTEGYVVNDIKIVAIFRDWSASRVGVNPDYPTQQVMTIPIRVFTQEQMRKAIEARMQLHLDAEKTDVIPDCTGAEKWASANSFNVKKKGLKRRVAGLATEELANNYIKENLHKYGPDMLYLEIVPGESKKCASYCAVRSVCPQKAREDAENLKLSEE